MLTGSWSLSSELRVPAISRLQKIHNVSLVFSELARRCVTPEWKGDWLIFILIEAGLKCPSIHPTTKSFFKMVYSYTRSKVKVTSP